MAGLGQALSQQWSQKYGKAVALMEVALALELAGQHGGRVFLAQLHLSLGQAYQAMGALDSVVYGWNRDWCWLGF